MADEIVFSGLGDLTLTENLSNAYLLLAAERSALQNHPALMYVGDIGAGSRTNTLKVPHIGLMGYNLLASTSDGVAVANTALTDNSSTVAVARYSKSYEASDLARMTTGGLIAVDALAMDAVLSGALTLTSLVANLVDNFSTTVGSTGVNATMQNFLDAITANEIAHTEGPLLAILHPQQWGDIRADLALNSGGAIQFLPATQELISFRGTGFQGSLCGVDVVTSTFVPTANAGADRAGGMFGKGAILWADGSIPMEADPNMMVIAGKVLFERVRAGKSGLTAYVSHRYLGATEGIDGFGVSIITDA